MELTNKEIQEILPHRYPFLLVDKIVECEPGKYAKGIKCVSVNEPYFMGHFPDAPIMPGVLIVEALAQLCSVTIESDGTDESKIYVLLKADEFKFIKPVLPGDTLTLEVTKTGGGAGLVKFDCVASVDGGVRAKGKLAFCAVDRESIYE